MFSLVTNCCHMRNKCKISVIFLQESRVKTSYLTVLITLIMMNVKPTVALPDSTVLNHATTVSKQILKSYAWRREEGRFHHCDWSTLVT